MSGRETSTAQPLALLDRDGVLTQLVQDERTGLPRPPINTEEIVLADGVAGGLQQLRLSGYKLAVVSNQPDAATMKRSERSLDSVAKRFEDLLRQAGVDLDWNSECRHHPDGLHAVLGVACSCRKPNPGMLLQACQECDADRSKSVMIGDSVVDVLAANRSGIDSILIAPKHLYVLHALHSANAEPWRIVSTFMEAVQAATNRLDER